MLIVLLLIRLLLTVVFLVAGIAKLADRPGSRKALLNFGVPPAVAGPLGLLLPLTEIAIAVALVLLASAWWGALGALTLLLIFIAGISFNLVHGRTPDCHCFGQLYSAPAGWQTLARNSLLAILAGFLVWQGADNSGPSALSWITMLTALQWGALVFAMILLGLVVGEAWFLLHLLQQNGRLLLRIEALETQVSGKGSLRDTQPASPALPVAGLPMNVQAPNFRLADVDGAVHTLDSLRAQRKPVLLLFSDPGCGPCNALLPQLAQWQESLRNIVTLVVISRGTMEANRAKQAEHNLSYMLLQQDREVAEAYKAYGTPSAVLVRPDGMIGSALAQGAAAIQSLVKEAGATSVIPPPVAVTSSAMTNGCRCGQSNGHGESQSQIGTLGVGDRMPSFTLPDLTGTPRDLTTLLGEPTLLLFWNPNCGFCQRMLDDLKVWEREMRAGTPRLLVISTGTAVENNTMGLKSPILLDPNSQVSRAFGAPGTPSAILVNAHGTLASEVAVGASAILTLASTNSVPAQPVSV